MGEKEYILTLDKHEVDLILYLVGEIWNWEELHDKIITQCSLSEGLYKKANNKKGKIAWIEGLLKIKCKDGRNNITRQVLIPYFKNVCQLTISEGLIKLNAWLDLCEYEGVKRDKVIHAFKADWYHIKPKVMPLSFENFKKHFEGVLE